MRKMLSKEITFTHVKVAVLEVMEDGSPKAIEQPPIELLGDISIERADKMIAKDYKGKMIMIYSIETEKRTYEMEVEEFIKVASIKVKENVSE